MIWKHFFYFNKREQHGILILIVLVAGIFIGKFILSDTNDNEVEVRDESLEFVEHKNADTLNGAVRDIDAPIKKNRPYHFDPNEANIETFIDLGLSEKTGKNIISYRQKGGRFYKAEDFRKIYGLSAEQAALLIPYIQIEGKGTKKKQSTFANNKPLDSKKAASLDTETVLANKDMEPRSAKRTFEKQEKYALGIKVDINAADTSELKKIPGIGQSFAQRIIKYRQVLGGFYDISQIKEVYGMEEQYEKIMPWLEISVNTIEPLKINSLSLDRLKSHPYINFYQAKAIVELRKKKGRLNSLSDLRLLEEFGDKDFERLAYYFSFE
ncbi:competence protein ComEA [Bacteroidales bacterium]|nr:competence protein ComEA [Bacteroidales bacterium]